MAGLLVDVLPLAEGGSPWDWLTCATPSPVPEGAAKGRARAVGLAAAARDGFRGVPG
jgi:hypothetical protein